MLRILVCLAFGLSLAASPAHAQAPAAAPALPTFVDIDIAKDPENVLHLDLSNGGRDSHLPAARWAPARG